MGSGMSFEELVRVVDRIGQTPQVDRFELTVGDVTISLRRAAGDAAVAAPATVAAAPASGVPDAPLVGVRHGPHQVTAPMVGFFQRAYASGGAPLVDVGTRVSADTQVGVIDAAKRMIPVFAGCDGVIAQVMAENGSPVAFGTPLMIVGSLADAAGTPPSPH